MVVALYRHPAASVRMLTANGKSPRLVWAESTTAWPRLFSSLLVSKLKIQMHEFLFIPCVRFCPVYLVKLGPLPLSDVHAPRVKLVGLAHIVHHRSGVLIQRCCGQHLFSVLQLSYVPIRSWSAECPSPTVGSPSSDLSFCRHGPLRPSPGVGGEKSL